MKQFLKDFLGVLKGGMNEANAILNRIWWRIELHFNWDTLLLVVFILIVGFLMVRGISFVFEDRSQYGRVICSAIVVDGRVSEGWVSIDVETSDGVRYSLPRDQCYIEWREE